MYAVILKTCNYYALINIRFINKISIMVIVNCFLFINKRVYNCIFCMRINLMQESEC